MHSGPGKSVHGNGRLEYKGLFKNGVRHGRGTSYYDNGQVEYDDVTFKDGVVHGCCGTWYSADGLWRYSGEFRLGERHGYGYLEYLMVTDWVILYDGSWAQGLRDGEGTQYYPVKPVNPVKPVKSSQVLEDKVVEYQGTWHMGKRHGRGESYDADGRPVFEGLWSDDRFGSHGILYNWPAGSEVDYYEGDLCDGVPHGYGIMCYEQGSMYEGDFLDGQRHGFGRFTRKVDGRRRLTYEGDWVNDEHHGYGTSYCYLDSKGVKYQGFWARGAPHGYGTSYLPAAPQKKVKGTKAEKEKEKEKEKGPVDYQGFWADGKPVDSRGKKRMGEEVFEDFSTVQELFKRACVVTDTDTVTVTIEVMS